jgi:hypothetical protein
MDTARALLAAGWVALARGRRELALGHAASAAREAGVRRDRNALAESLELRALATSDRSHAADWLDEAAAIWRDLGNPAGQARAELEAALLGTAMSHECWPTPGKWQSSWAPRQ